MKRMKYVLAMVATLALLVSCSDKLVPEVEPEGPAKNVVFTATTESAGATKTVLDGNDTDGYDVLWEVGDEITIKDADGNVGLYRTSGSGTSARFTFVSGTEAVTAPFRAYYPASLYDSGSGSTVLPANRDYSANNVHESPMWAKSDDYNLEFKNICGLLRINLSTSPQLAGVKVRSISVSETVLGISGPFTIGENPSSWSYNQALVSEVGNGGAGVTLNCYGEGVAIGSEPTAFYITVQAGSYGQHPYNKAQRYLTIVVKLTDGTAQYYKSKPDGQAINVNRSQITNMNLTLTSPGVDVADATTIDVPAGSTTALSGVNPEAVINVGDGATVTIQKIRARQINFLGNATLILKGESSLGGFEPGGAYSLVTLADGGVVTIQGDGKLIANYSWVSGGKQTRCIYGNGDLVIESGTLDLNAGEPRTNYPAIDVRNLTVNGGQITAKGGRNDQYFGNAVFCSGNTLIHDGTVNVRGGCGIYAQGTLTIEGGSVTAETDNRRGVGSDGLFTISGGSLNAYNFNAGPAPGIFTGGDLHITGGTVSANANSKDYGRCWPGITVKSASCNILIEGGDVTAIGCSGSSSEDTPGIGTAATLGYGADACGDITITSGITRLVVTRGVDASVVIGKGNANSTIGTITIDGVENPTAESFFSDLNLEVSNGGRTWTFTPATNVPTSLANMKDMINAGKDASAYLGRYVYSNGNIGTDATSAIGRVAAVSAKNVDAGGVADARMLVIALTDLLAGSMVSCDDAQTAASNEGLAISGAEQTQWRIPSYDMWHAMTMGLGNADFVRLCAEAGMVEGQFYWSTLRENNYPYRYYYIYTTSYDYGQYRYYYSFSDGDKVKSRACFAY